MNSALLHTAGGFLEQLKHDGIDGRKLLPLPRLHRLHIGLQSPPKNTHAMTSEFNVDTHNAENKNFERKHSHCHHVITMFPC